jgi:hypothetical protein
VPCGASGTPSVAGRRTRDEYSGAATGLGPAEDLQNLRRIFSQASAGRGFTALQAALARGEYLPALGGSLGGLFRPPARRDER